MAIKALSWMVRVFEPPVYCFHEIVHNQIVVERFRQAGVVFVDDVDDVPLGAPLMLSAHGTAPEVVAATRGRGGVVVNAVCPLVTKVHHEVKVRVGKGFTVLYVGHAGHDEAVGTVAVAPGHVRLVQDEADVDRLPDPGTPVALLAQTTLSQHDWAGVMDAARQRFPDLWMPGRSDLCFATTNRQDALMAIAPRAETVIVIGSANSSNTVALVKMATAAGCARVMRVNAARDVPDDLEGVVGITAGASAPEELVDAVIARLAPSEGVEEIPVIGEDEYFPPPAELRNLLRGVAVALSVTLAAPVEPGVLLADDRGMDASDVLAGLTG
jgi:4-hydroxy-3-methylbut-2-enyl diphosphate reductase